MNKLVQALRRQLAKTGVLVRNELVWGYGKCGDELRLHEMYAAVKLLRNQELVGEKCLCQEEIDSIVSQAKGLLGPECFVGEYDFTKTRRADYESWILQNPNCIGYELRADYNAAQCKRIGIDFKVVEKKCSDVGIDVKVTDVVICDAIDLVLEVENKTCVLDIDLKVELQKCIIDFETKVRPYVCDLDLKTYITEISCGADITTVLTKYECVSDLILTTGVAQCPSSGSLSASISPSASVSPSVSPSISESTSPSGSPVDFDFEVTTEDVTICYYTDIVVSLDNVTDENADFAWDWEFGSGAIYDGDTGLGPHTVRWTSAGVKTITVTGDDGNGPIERTLQVTVSTCLGNLTGSLVDTFGDPIQGVNVRLYNDVDLNGIADDATTVRSVFTNSSGQYSMASLTPGSYVIVVTNPANFTIVSGIDTSDDSDLVSNIPTTDLIIPVTITPSEIDFDNNFIFTTNPGIVSGYVFVDADLDESPDGGEGVAGVTVEIFEDTNQDGVSDGVLIDSTTTDTNGYYQFTNIATNTYAGRRRHGVIVITVPGGYTLVKDFDASDDSDNVVNSNTTDGIIPFSLQQGETDANNYFIIQPI